MAHDTVWTPEQLPWALTGPMRRKLDVASPRFAWRKIEDAVDLGAQWYKGSCTIARTGVGCCVGVAARIFVICNASF